MPAIAYVTATEARKNFFGLIEKTKRSSSPVNITIKGIPEVVIMNKGDYDAWVATIETLTDDSMMKAIKQGDRDIKAGRVHKLEDVLADIGFDAPSNPLKSGKKRVKKTG